MQIKINVFLLVAILYSSIGYTDEVQRVTYASWNKPDVELLYVLPKEINKNTKVLFIIHGGGRNVDKYLNLWRKPAIDKNVILVAPHFTRENYQFYATLGMARSSGDIIDNKVNWLTNSIASFHTFFKSKFNLDYIAIKDVFVDSGKPIELEKKYGFDPLNIARRFSEIENS